MILKCQFTWGACKIQIFEPHPKRSSFSMCIRVLQRNRNNRKNYVSYWSLYSHIKRFIGLGIYIYKYMIYYEELAPLVMEGKVQQFTIYKLETQETSGTVLVRVQRPENQEHQRSTSQCEGGGNWCPSQAEKEHSLFLHLFILFRPSKH